jgi:hypothetical protein
MKRYYMFAVGIGVMVAMVAVIGLSTTLVAQEPGDVGSAECGAVQLDAQAAVEDGGPYRNHGQMVRTAANNQSPALEAGDITEECSSCIMNQFARKIPIADQESCGSVAPSNPECAAATCSTFTECNTGGNCGTGGICGSVYEGGGTCINGGTLCAGLTVCENGTGDCAVGELCIVETCCGDNVCIPPDTFCWPAP